MIAVKKKLENETPLKALTSLQKDEFSACLGITVIVGSSTTSIFRLWVTAVNPPGHQAASWETPKPCRAIVSS